MRLANPATLGRYMLCALTGCGLVVACSIPARAQATRPARDAVKPFAAFSESVHSMRDSLVALAKAQVGTKYVRGGTTPEHGFDCSGLVRYVMAALKVELPRTAQQQSRSGLAVTRDTTRLRPGDLLTFGRSSRGVSHIGIYVGGGRYIHASSGAGRVIESDIGRTSSSLVRAWRGVRRVVAGIGADTASGGS
ncbi:MAG: C40 family peptidase [bacterium]